MDQCPSQIDDVRKEAQKASDHCAKVQKTSTEEGLNIQLWIPVALTVIYTYLLRLVSKDWLQTPEIFSQCSFEAPIIASLLYLLSIYFGRNYMKNKSSWQMKNYMLTYNFYQTVLNAWCVYAFIAELIHQGYPVWGNKLGETSYQLSFLIWIHYNNKYVELLDTFFMVVRKKENQISFLHVYHHVLLIWAWFLVCKFGSGGDAYFGAMMNSGVHVIMYGYYLLTLLGIPCPWKQYITQIQLGQFVVCLISALYVWVKGLYPWYLCIVQVYVMLNMLVLFIDFYRKSYSNRTPRQKQQQDAQKIQ